MTFLLSYCEDCFEDLYENTSMGNLYDCLITTYLPNRNSIIYNPEVIENPTNRLHLQKCVRYLETHGYIITSEVSPTSFKIIPQGIHELEYEDNVKAFRICLKKKDKKNILP